MRHLKIICAICNKPVPLTGPAACGIHTSDGRWAHRHCVSDAPYPELGYAVDLGRTEAAT